MQHVGAEVAATGLVTKPGFLVGIRLFFSPLLRMKNPDFLNHFKNRSIKNIVQYLYSKT